MNLKELLFILALVAFALAAAINLIPKPPDLQYSRDIDTIRTYQRECLDREPSHSFTLIQTNGGYFVACKPITK